MIGTALVQLFILTGSVVMPVSSWNNLTTILFIWGSLAIVLILVPTLFTNSNNTMEVSYTGMGNAYETNWKVSSSSNSWYLKTGTTYTADGNRILTQTDANNITTTYTYNSGSGTDATQGLIGQLKTSYTGSTYPTTYHYSPDNGRQTMTFQSNRIAAHFSYNAQGFTNAIARKSYSRNSYDANPSGTAQWQSYKFATDSFGYCCI